MIEMDQLKVGDGVEFKKDRVCPGCGYKMNRGLAIAANKQFAGPVPEMHICAQCTCLGIWVPELQQLCEVRAEAFREMPTELRLKIRHAQFVLAAHHYKADSQVMSVTE